MATFSQQQGIPIWLGSVVFGSAPAALALDPAYDHYITKIALGLDGLGGVCIVTFSDDDGNFLWSGVIDGTAALGPLALEGGEGLVLQGLTAPTFSSYGGNVRAAVYGYRLKPSAATIFSG